MEEEKSQKEVEEKKELTEEKKEENKEAKKSEEKPKKKKNKEVRRLVKIILFLVLVIFVLVIFFASALLKKTSVAPSTDANEVAENFDEYYGTIEGSLGYPSDYIPVMGICAINEKTEEAFCSYEMLEDDEYTYGLGYEIEVPTGTYNVYAQLVDTGEEEVDTKYKAYYSKFVTCGMSVECESHKAIDVKVKGGETENNIDPQDWYK